MCGRYDLHEPAPRIAEVLGAQLLLDGWEAHYNIPPGQTIPIARIDGSDSRRERVLAPAWWGFRPAWADADAPAPINARAEKAASSPYFREAFAHHRCLVPANGWYEWQQTGSGKQPHYFTHVEGELLMFAGLWTPGEGGSRCAILTEPARGLVKPIHTRMPVVLEPLSWAAWLSPELTERDTIREATSHLAPETLTQWPVSPRVNRPDADDAGLLEPLNGPG